MELKKVFKKYKEGQDLGWFGASQQQHWRLEHKREILSKSK